MPELNIKTIWTDVWGMTYEEGAEVLGKHVLSVFKEKTPDALEETRFYWFEMAFRNPVLAEDILSELTHSEGMAFLSENAEEAEIDGYILRCHRDIKDGQAVQRLSQHGIPDYIQINEVIAEPPEYQTNHQRFRYQRIFIYGGLLIAPVRVLPMVEAWWCNNKESAYAWGVGEVARRLWKDSPDDAIAILTTLADKLGRYPIDSLFFLREQAMSPSTDNNERVHRLTALLRKSGIVLSEP